MSHVPPTTPLPPRRTESRPRERPLNILMLGHWLASALWEADIRRAHGFARHLARRHRVTLAFVTDDPSPYRSITALRAKFGDLEFAVVPRAWKRLCGAVRLARGDSATVTRCRSAALEARLRDRSRADAYDVVFVSSAAMLPYVSAIESPAPLLVDYGDIDSEWWTRRARQRSRPWAAMARLEAARLRQVEIGAARRAARCLVATQEAAAVLSSFAPWAPSSIVPSGVDLDDVAPLPRPTTAPTVLFSGGSDVDTADDVAAFAHSAFSGVRARIPEARLVVVSEHATGAFKRLARLPGVELAAPVIDVRPFLDRAAVAVAPIRSGRAMQPGLLEAMAAGVPVVTTSRGHGGLKARPGQDLYVEDDPGVFARRVIQLLEGQTLRAEMGTNARSFVARHHTWEAAAQRLLSVVEEMVRRWRAGLHPPFTPLVPAPRTG
jgi:glycosyltransferase involved in cell wall biosynthesis